MAKLQIKKGDTVVVISGKDKGKQGTVIATEPKKERVFVEGVNTVKRHTKPSRASSSVLALVTIMISIPVTRST